MKKFGKQIVQSLVGGFLLPSALLLLVLGASAKSEPQQQPTGKPVTLPQQVTLATQPELPLFLPVQVDGEVVNWELEAYLVGVLLAEVPAGFEMETLKAQAVAARTYALKCHYKGYKHLGAICVESTCCQGYCSIEEYIQKGGTLTQVQKIQQAVSETKGEVLTYQGDLIEATYFASSGGKTEDAKAVWGTEVPYLQSVESPEEEAIPSHEQTIVLSVDALSEALGIETDTEPEHWLGNITYTNGGGVDLIEIDGVQYRGVTLRKLLQLRSTVFTISWDRDVFLITTRGYGHRVGMSQYGAEAMAMDGCDYLQILQHYYRGTQIALYDKITLEKTM